jgi:glycosyltransferase involved in cell wall biosynthesis
MKKTVVFLRSNPIAPDPRVEKEARVLVEEGYDVRIIGWDRTCELPKFEHSNIGIIERLHIKANFGTGLKNLPYLFKWQWELFKYLMKNKFDIIHSCDFDTILPAIVSSRFKKNKVVYDIFDFYSEMLRNTPSYLKKMIKWADFYAIKKSDALIICDDSRFEQINGSKPKKTTVIYNSPEEGNSNLYTTENELKKKGKYSIAYVGLLQTERGIMEMMHVISNKPDWFMDIAGFGGDEKLIKDFASQHKNIHFHGRVDYATSLKISRNADVLFATYDPSIPNHRYSSANKLFEAMMLGKPIIVCENTGMDQIVKDLDNGFVLEYGNKSQLERTLEAIASDESKRRRLGQNSRLGYEHKYGWNVMKEKLIDLYKTL